MLEFTVLSGFPADSGYRLKTTLGSVVCHSSARQQRREWGDSAACPRQGPALWLGSCLFCKQPCKEPGVPQGSQEISSFFAFSFTQRCRGPLFRETGGGWWLMSRMARHRCFNRGRLAASHNLCSSPLPALEFNSYKLWIIYCSSCKLQTVLQFTEHKEHWCLIFFELWVHPEIGDSDYYNQTKLQCHELFRCPPAVHKATRVKTSVGLSCITTSAFCKQKV